MKLDVIGKAMATILAAAIMVAAGIVVGLNMDRFFGRGTAEPSASPKVLAPKIDPDAREYEEGETSSSGIAIPGWTKLRLPADMADVTSGIDFYNPDQNDGRYMLTYQLCLEESGEILYQSGQIPAGKHIQGISLARPLVSGEYDGVLHVQPYSVQEPTKPLNHVDIRLTLIVQ